MSEKHILKAPQGLLLAVWVLSVFLKAWKPSSCFLKKAKGRQSALQAQRVLWMFSRCQLVISWITALLLDCALTTDMHTAKYTGKVLAMEKSFYWKPASLGLMLFYLPQGYLVPQDVTEMKVECHSITSILLYFGYYQPTGAGKSSCQEIKKKLVWSGSHNHFSEYAGYYNANYRRCKFQLMSPQDISLWNILP